MTDQMINFFLSFFANPSAIGIALALVFGVIWLALYRALFFKRRWFWVIMVVSAFLTLAAIAFIQIPLQNLSTQLLIRSLGHTVVLQWQMLIGIIPILLSGLVQEGAKLVPVVVYWLRKGRNVTPGLGLAAGAVAGAGFGIFEAQWVHNIIFASGWSWDLVSTHGVIGLAGFWERFFSIGAHVGFSALAGYGLARGKGWQFYLLASVLHGLLNYSALTVQVGLLSIFQVELFIAVFVVLVTLVTLWINNRNRESVTPL